MCWYTVFRVFACLLSPSPLSLFSWNTKMKISELHLPSSGLSVGNWRRQAVLHDIVLCSGIRHSLFLGSADLAALVWWPARKSRCSPKRKLQRWKGGQARRNVRQERETKAVSQIYILLSMYLKCRPLQSGTLTVCCANICIGSVACWHCFVASTMSPVLWSLRVWSVQCFKLNFCLTLHSHVLLFVNSLCALMRSEY